MNDNTLNICNAAFDLVGTPYRHQGRSKHGIDCGGLVVLTGRKVGLIPENWDIKYYVQSEVLVKYTPRFQEIARLNPVVEIRPGQILLFKMGGAPRHFGIMTRFNKFVHCDMQHGTIVSRLNDKWRRRIYQTWTFKGLKHG